MLTRPISQTITQTRRPARGVLKLHGKTLRSFHNPGGIRIGIDRDDRFALLHEGANPLVQIAKLPIPIGMIRPFIQGFEVRLLRRL